MIVSRAISGQLLGVLLAFASASADEFRLPTDIRPTFEAIHLNLDPGRKEYTGTVEVDLELSRSSEDIRFHAAEMDLDRVRLKQGSKSLDLVVSKGVDGMVSVRAPTTLKPGRYRLSLEFTNNLSSKGVSLYRQQSRGDWYVFSQFQAIYAREAFPCWDEPSFKIPYQVTVTIPKGLHAVSNSRVASENVGPRGKTVVFERTKPLPSYLLAIGVGPLEFVPIPNLRVPGRIVVPKGAAPLAATAVRTTPPIFDAIERYFGIPYPYEKLDLIAVPIDNLAMENAGAITFAERYILLDETAGTDQLRLFIELNAHEIAHMWFGDYVTMKWWDDLWLNESFADWLCAKITEEVYPEYMSTLRAVQRARYAFELDAQLSTRAIRQPVSRVETLSQLADALAYFKGEMILGMTERWLGEPIFRRGVGEYLRAHAHGLADATDLWDSLDRASGKQVSGLMSGFLDQPGVPIVHADLGSDGTVVLSQRRFLNFGKDSPAPQLWQIPVRLRWNAGGRLDSMVVLLDKESARVQLPRGARSRWVHPNAGEVGYYHWSVDSTSLARLGEDASEALDVRERIGFIQNALALLRSGTIHGDQYIHILTAFSGDSHPSVITTLLNSLIPLKVGFLREENEEVFAAYVRQCLAPALRRIGMERRSGEAEMISIVRPMLYSWLGQEGRDPEVMKRAEQIGRSFLRDRSSVDASLATAAVRLMASRGDSILFEDLRMRFESATIPSDRRLYLLALSSFQDSRLRARALDYTLTGPLRPQEMFTISLGMATVPKQQDEVWDWWERNYSRAASRMPSSYVSNIPWMAEGCSETRLRRAEEFFRQPDHSPPGTAHELAIMAEATRDCVGLRAREGDAVDRAMRRATLAK